MITTEQQLQLMTEIAVETKVKLEISESLVETQDELIKVQVKTMESFTELMQTLLKIGRFTESESDNAVELIQHVSKAIKIINEHYEQREPKENESDS